MTRILAETTPRPWQNHENDIYAQDDLIAICFPPNEGKIATADLNATLIVLAVSAYEADQERIRVLTEALETIASWQFNISGDCVADARTVARSALSVERAK